jgi:hypothetical protein
MVPLACEGNPHFTLPGFSAKSSSGHLKASPTLLLSATAQPFFSMGINSPKKAILKIKR